MHVGLTSLQSSLINYSARQHIFKPIVLLVAGIALAIISGLCIGSVINGLCIGLNARNVNRRSYRYPSTGSHGRATPSPYPRSGSQGSAQVDRGEIRSTMPTTYRGLLRVDSAESLFYQISPHIWDLESMPMEYITSLAKAVRSMGINMSTRVNFRKDDGLRGEACDAGGPRRQYFSLIFQCLKAFVEEKKGVMEDLFCLHRTKMNTFLIPQGNSPSGDVSSSFFYDIGTVLAYIYCHSEDYVIGPVFHESIFAAMLSLNVKEIELPYANLSDATKLKLCKVLINTQQHSGENFDDYTGILQFLEKGAQFTESDLRDEKVKNFYAMAAFNEDSREFLGKEGDEFDFNAVRFDWKKIKDNKSQFFSKFLSYFLKQKVDSLGTIELTLFSVHTMAKAMKAAAGTSWGEISLISGHFSASSPGSASQMEVAREFQRKVQGVLDRKRFVSSIKEYSGLPVVTQQVAWLKAWIMDSTTTDAQVAGLLQFWTGASNLNPKTTVELSVSGLSNILLPKSSSCSRSLYVATSYSTQKNAEFHNRDQEGFYRMLNAVSSPAYHSLFTNG